MTLLDRRRSGADGRLNEIRFRSMIELALTLTAFSLLPLIPFELGSDDATAWRIVTAAYAAAS